MDKENEQTIEEKMFEKEYAEFVTRVGLKIGYYRRAGSMTQKELATAIKLSRTHISQIESRNEDYVPSLKSLLKISKTLGVKVYKFLDVEND